MRAAHESHQVACPHEEPCPLQLSLSLPAGRSTGAARSSAVLAATLAGVRAQEHLCTQQAQHRQQPSAPSRPSRRQMERRMRPAAPGPLPNPDTYTLHGVAPQGGSGAGCACGHSSCGLLCAAIQSSRPAAQQQAGWQGKALTVGLHTSCRPPPHSHHTSMLAGTCWKAANLWAAHPMSPSRPHLPRAPSRCRSQQLT
jgi:hypothetical protein